MATIESIQNNPADILVASLEALRTPAEMGEGMFQGGKAVDILNFRDEGSQRRDITYGKVFRLIRQPVKKVGYLLLHSLNSCCQSCDSFPQDGYLNCQGWLSLKYSHTTLGCLYQGFSHNFPHSAPN